MENQDTISLLRECDAGTKMAVSSLDDVINRVNSQKLETLLTESREHHEKLGNELHELLLKAGSNDKDPNPMAKSMSWIKTNMMMAMKDSDKTIADLLTDGCDMGIKSLHKYHNQYQNAEHSATDICRRLIDIEEQLRDGLKEYL